jgi:pyruvate dehydrogenase E2 component (dihydrolipoamide acetyltransferase)
MATPVEMPRPGITVEECLLVKWRAKKGEPVAAGQVIAEIETDKAGFEVEAPGDGVLLETFFDEGELVPVFTNICVIGRPGEDVEAFRPRRGAPAAEKAPKQAEAEPAQPAPAAEAFPRGVPEPAAEAAFSPRARRFAEEHGFFPQGVRGSGPGGRVLEEDLKRLYFAAPRTSPVARELVASGFVAPAEGSGVNRMVRAADLDEAPVQLAGVREIIARRMRESLATSAQYTLHSSADATGLVALRRRFKQTGADININDLVMYCVVRALTEMPELNAELIEGRIWRRRRIHLGFACDTPRGLIVPVIKDSQELSLEELAARAHRLAEQAVSGAIDPGDITGATFTVSNLGSFGIESFTPILNPPQVALLGVNAIQLKPVRRNGAVEFVEHIGLSLTLDHQVIDGAHGARFLGKLREKIEAVEALAGPAT